MAIQGNMTRKEAIAAMRVGLKVSHEGFTNEEWATQENGVIVLEDGVRCSPAEFWKWRQEAYFDKGWRIWEG